MIHQIMNNFFNFSFIYLWVNLLYYEFDWDTKPMQMDAIFIAFSPQLLHQLGTHKKLIRTCTYTIERSLKYLLHLPEEITHMFNARYLRLLDFLESILHIVSKKRFFAHNPRMELLLVSKMGKRSGILSEKLICASTRLLGCKWHTHSSPSTMLSHRVPTQSWTFPLNEKFEWYLQNEFEMESRTRERKRMGAKLQTKK